MINTFIFSTPWLSWLAVIVLLIASVILYTVPLRYLILVWGNGFSLHFELLILLLNYLSIWLGVNKFTKKFRKPPNYIDNTEILDFLSRLPSKIEMFHYKELRLEKNSQSSNSNTSSVPLSKDKKTRKKW